MVLAAAVAGAHIPVEILSLDLVRFVVLPGVLARVGQNHQTENHQTGDKRLVLSEIHN